jgi:uncharacterized membrane protein YdbT with pleckstrin-like domain
VGSNPTLSAIFFSYISKYDWMIDKRSFSNDPFNDPFAGKYRNHFAVGSIMLINIQSFIITALYPLAWEKNDLPMKFIKSTLPDNETIEMEIAFHWTHSLIAWLALFFLGWLIVGIFIFISMYIEKWTTERALTNKRLVIKRGLISRQTEEMSFNRIEEVNLNQSILQRLLGSGNIRVTGTGSGEVVMKNIDDPLAVQKKLNEVRQYL